MLKTIDRISSVSVEDIKKYLKIDFQYEDELIQEMIYIAEDYYESKFREILGIKTFEYKKDNYSSFALFKKFPLIEIISIKANNINIEYKLHINQFEKCFSLSFDEKENVIIIFKAGYLNNTSNNSYLIKSAIIKHVTKLYNTRDQSISSEELNEIYKFKYYARI